MNLLLEKGLIVCNKKPCGFLHFLPFYSILLSPLKPAAACDSRLVELTYGECRHLNVKFAW